MCDDAMFQSFWEILVTVVHDAEAAYGRLHLFTLILSKG